MKYRSLYERLVAHTALAEPNNSNSCWLWTGVVDARGYPRFSGRVAGKVKQRRAHRAMLEEVHQVEFPFDEAGHLCCTPLCIRPDCLEVQTQQRNLSDRRGYAATDGCMIPTLFPRRDLLQEFADRAWDGPGVVHPAGEPCPF